jgi:hypothetical protein
MLTIRLKGILIVSKIFEIKGNWVKMLRNFKLFASYCVNGIYWYSNFVADSLQEN